MSFALSPIQITALPSTQHIAQKLASRMIRVDCNIEKIMKLFSENAVFIFSKPDSRMNCAEFITAMRKGNKENITEIGSWSNTFNAVENSNTDIQWIVEGYQFRLGKGMMEESAGWYKIKQVIILKFTNENEKRKISEWHSAEYIKIKQ